MRVHDNGTADSRRAAPQILAPRSSVDSGQPEYTEAVRIQWWIAIFVMAVCAVAVAQSGFTVVIPVLVLDHQGQPIAGLDGDQFRLSDNGRLQRLTSFASANTGTVTLALVVDTGDPDAVGQAQRSAGVITGMVVGDLGQTSVYIAGPDPHQVLGFTDDSIKVADVLLHLEHSPVAPQGTSPVAEATKQALLDLSHRPATETRAILIIAKDIGGGAAAEATLQTALAGAIPIFRISPKRPQGAAAPSNPDSVEAGGTGAGSQREQQLPQDANGRGTVASSGTDVASIDLTPAAGAAKDVAGAIVAPHAGDYVYASGGMALDAGSDADFDRKLASIGADLRGLYWLYYQPDDLAMHERRHAVTLRVFRQPGQVAPAKLAYRHGYWAPIK